MASNNPSRKQSAPSPKQSAAAPRPSHDAISQRARELWQSRGQPSGQDDAIWLEAESQLTSPSATNAMLQATGQLERGDDEATRRGAQRSARGNIDRERGNDDPDI